MIQAHILYSGTVQGVGFRYTALGYASELKLKGWVKNLPDGGVEIMAQGPKTSIENFCKKLDAHFEGYIKNKTINYFDIISTFPTFQITH